MWQGVLTVSDAHLRPSRYLDTMYYCTTVLVCLLPLVRPHPSQPSSAADQLTELLGPALETAVQRALASRQICHPDCGQQALAELGRLEGRLDGAIHGLAEVKVQLGRLEGRLDSRTVDLDACRRQTSNQEPVPQTTPEPQPKSACEKHPVPLSAGEAPYQDPTVYACARSCLELRDQVKSPQDGVYWLTGLPVPVLCDFSHDGGGWTLLLTVASREGWNPLAALKRNPRSPSLTENYAILYLADAIRDTGSGDRFAYRIEAQAETGRQRWGGIWLAPRNYSFVHETPSQTEVGRVKSFDVWEYKDTGIEQRMPWLNLNKGSAVLTTSASSTSQWYGTLITHETTAGYSNSPWIHPEAIHSGKVLYWVREEPL